MNKKRGQVTIFIIVGILIVTVILLLAVLKKDGAEVVSPIDLGPRDFVVSCVEDIVEDSIDKMMRNGGEITPTQPILYKNELWNYLCYQVDLHQGCYNNHPMLELQIEKEIEIDTSAYVLNCFSNMTRVFRDRGFDVSEGVMNYSVNLLPGFVRVNLKKDVEISEESGSQSFDDFGFEVQSPIYDLVRVTREIVNSESQFCNFEYNGYMILYPKYDIQRVDYNDNKMYRVIDRWTGDEFKFAVRSCAFVPRR